MKFLSVDIETTGLDESYCQILEIGCVFGDLTSTPVDELPFWSARLYFDKVIGQPYALHLNSKLILAMTDRVSMPGFFEYMSPDSVSSSLTIWLEKVVADFWNPKTKLTIAGKNYGSFDRRFLTLLPRWPGHKFHHRYLDPAMLFWHPDTDEVLPDTKECIKRAKIEWDDKLLHSAVADTRLVVELVRAGIRYKEPIS